MTGGLDITTKWERKKKVTSHVIKDDSADIIQWTNLGADEAAQLQTH